MTTNDFDPQEPYVDEKGFEYRNFAAYLAGERLQNGRNRKIEYYWSWIDRQASRPNDPDYLDEWIWNYYIDYDGDGFALQGPQYADEHWPAWYEERCKSVPASAHRFRAGAERYWRLRAEFVAQTACPPSGDGGPGAVPAQAAAVHPADEPEVPRGVGA